MNKTEKFWDRTAKQWDAGGNQLDETSIKAIEKTKIYLNDEDNVLEYGCGIGTISIELAGIVKEIHAIDISSKMIEVAARTAGERNIENIHYKQGTIFDDGLNKGSFSVITAFNILHLLDDLPKVIQRVNQLLKPGGVFISTSACLGEKKSLFGIFLSLLSKTGLVPYINMLTTTHLENLLVDENFHIVETEILRESPMNYFIAARKK